MCHGSTVAWSMVRSCDDSLSFLTFSTLDSAMESALKPQIIATFEQIATTFTKLQRAQDKLVAEDIIRLLDQVPDRSADVFRYHAIEGYSHEEISQLMQISVGTSKWHLANAREKLKNLLMSMDHVRTSSF